MIEVFYFSDENHSKAYASESLLAALQFNPGNLLRRTEVPNNTQFNYKGLVEVDPLTFLEEVDVTLSMKEFVINRLSNKRGKIQKHLTSAEYTIISDFLDLGDNNPSASVRNINTKLKSKVKKDTSLIDREGHSVVYALDIMISSKSYPIRAAWIAEHISNAEHKTSNKAAEKTKIERKLNKIIKNQTGWNI